MSQRFTHLHCHSQYSLLDGAGKIELLLDHAKELGMDSLAITDHGNLHGALDFYRKAKERSIKPILGIEAYIAPDSRFRKSAASTSKEASFHLTLLAKNRTGFRNLIKLSSAAFLEGFYYKPRIDRELLAAHSEGLICLSGCLASEVNSMLLGGGEANKQRAKDTARWFQSVFGDRYFIEIQNNGIAEQKMALELAADMADELGLPIVATSDVHYVRQDDFEAQDILLCINTRAFRTDSRRMRMETDQFYLRSPEEMYTTFSDRPDAVARAQEIADQVDIELELGKRHFPIYSPPESKTPEEYLYDLCIEGLKENYRTRPDRYHDGQFSEEVMNRLDRELYVINKLGFANYFLIVWDFVRFARSRGIQASARGSGVGSLVAYALHMSHVCPLEFDLLFERFLDENRREAPDIDIDFCKVRRSEAIEYVKEKYGHANVAQICNFLTLGAKAAIKDVGLAMNIPLSQVEQLTKLVPEQPHIKLEEAIETSPDLKRIYDTDGHIRELLDLAKKVEGLSRNLGTHAAGVVIADQPLTEYVPLAKVTGKDDIITQWSMADVEAAGLLKMDFLGLRNMTILSNVVALIEKTRGEKIDPYILPLDDKKTYELFARGETKGVFQFESGGIRDMLCKMKPDCFRDLIASNALYRPGPLEGGMVDDYIDVKHGRKQAEYKHPVIREILEETHGVMVYQEQVMRIINRIGDIELSSAYSCIKAISKKKLPLIAKFREEFLIGAEKKGLSRKEGEELFSLIEKFAGYGFNKSHSTAYAQLAYITGYLKVHYPIEFMAALMTSDISERNFKSKDSLIEHLEDARRMGIEVLPPDINASEAIFTVEKGAIRFGLSAIRGCGEGAAAEIFEQRLKSRFKDIFDFCERVNPGLVNKSAIAALIKGGAMDSLGARRSQMMAVHERAIEAGASIVADRLQGQMGLFGGDDFQDDAPSISLPDLPEWNLDELCENEKEVLGCYWSSNPLSQYEVKLNLFRTHTIHEALQLPHRSEVTLGGKISSVKFAHTKNSQPGKPTAYAMFDFEDASGMVRTIMWPTQFQDYGSLVKNDELLFLTGTLEIKGDADRTTATFLVNEAVPFKEAENRFTTTLMIRYDERIHGDKNLAPLREILRGYPGQRKVKIQFILADNRKVISELPQLSVDMNEMLLARIDDLLGKGNYRTLAEASRPRVRN